MFSDSQPNQDPSQEPEELSPLAQERLDATLDGGALLARRLGLPRTQLSDEEFDALSEFQQRVETSLGIDFFAEEKDTPKYFRCGPFRRDDGLVVNFIDIVPVPEKKLTSLLPDLRMLNDADFEPRRPEPFRDGKVTLVHVMWPEGSGFAHEIDAAFDAEGGMEAIRHAMRIGNAQHDEQERLATKLYSHLYELVSRHVENEVLKLFSYGISDQEKNELLATYRQEGFYQIHGIEWDSKKAGNRITVLVTAPSANMDIAGPKFLIGVGIDITLDNLSRMKLHQVTTEIRGVWRSEETEGDDEAPGEAI